MLVLRVFPIRRRSRLWRRSWPIVVVAAVSLLHLSPASAAPVDAMAEVDATSDVAAAFAYGHYLKAAASLLPASKSADDAFISSVSASCPNVLSATNQLPIASTNKNATLAFGSEVRDDVLVVALGAIRGDVGKLARTLARLGWSSGEVSKTVTRYTASAPLVVDLSPSDICGDARALAASNAQATPPGTLQWLATVGRDGTAETRAHAAFIKVLERYQTSADRSLVKADNDFAKRLAAATYSLVTAELSKLGSVLGIFG